MSKTQLNKAKNQFVKWLKDHKAENIDVYEGEAAAEWQYYRVVTAFIGNDIYTVYFMMWNDEIKIDYSDEENNYRNLSIEEFLELII